LTWFIQLCGGLIQKQDVVGCSTTSCYRYVHFLWVLYLPKPMCSTVRGYTSYGY